MPVQIFFMEENMKRLCSVVVLLVLGFSAAFAGGRSQGGSVAVGPADYGARTIGPNFWMVKYDRPVTLHVVNQENPNVVFRTGDSTENNAWTRGIKESLNVAIVTDWVSSASEYTTKLNLAIAAGQLPDVFRCNAVQFRQLLDAGLIADITDYIENNASDTMKSIMAYAPEVVETAKRNGRLYAMPTFGYGPLPMPELLWIRHDWMLASGTAAPQTIADMESLMQTFMRAHPGSYGVWLDRSLDAMYYLAPAFKAYPSIWVTAADGTIVHGAVQNEMREILRTFADWYTKGYLKQDFMAMDGDAIRPDLAAGKFGIQIFRQYWYTYASDVINNQGKEAYFEAYELPSVDGHPVIHPQDYDNGGYLVINKNCKNIDAAIKCMSYIQYIIVDSIAQGIMTQEQLDQFLYSQSQHLMTMFKIDDPINEETQYREIQEAKRTGKAVFTSSLTMTKYNNAILWETNKDVTGIVHWLQVYADRAAYASNIKVVEENRFLLTRLMGPGPEDLVAYGSTLDDILKEGFTKIIIGQEPLSYFDALVREWRTAGGDVATAAVNRDYGKK
jgi:putative aldouronate transport system substrate-binding protein